MNRWAPHRMVCALVLCLAFGACVMGWKLLWFLTDDAYIAFRYIGNHQLGHGYTWNPAPFRPVEGYTSFLWVVILDAVWTVTGVEPPRSANTVSLIASIGSLGLLSVWACRSFACTRPWERPCLLALTLGLVVSNRNFLVWSSSGMETALFNLWVLIWLYCVFAAERHRARHVALAATAALLIGLTRPDGLLFASATVGLVVWLRLQGQLSTRQAIVSVLPLCGIAAHLLWRRSYYGAWLPNTYYAKVGGAHPEVGLRFLAAFTLEYAIWFWAFVVGCWSLRRRPRSVVGTLSVGALCGVCVLVAHAAYYVLIVGGDHFEFRVFSHLAAPMALGFVVAARRLCEAPAAIGLGLVFGALASVIPWTHFAQTRGLVTREQTFGLRVAVAPALPMPLRPLGWAFDDLEQWLIPRGVGVRHQEHKAFQWSLKARFPARDESSKFAFQQPLPVMVASWVGVAGWSLPSVYILDYLGLNDYVIARTPLETRELSYMAHERRPPPGYLGSFQPNVLLQPGRKLAELPRAVALTDESVRQIEARYGAIVDAL